ncbi:MAG TPA: DUF6600 domain-containing protein, partial [Anaeromyxobacter sp.]|nr:DUF6600 domain-containing protein [Anaeromyxobacter sp.]
MIRWCSIPLGVVLAVALAPPGARADDWEQEPPGWSEPPAEGYDVAVDVDPGGDVSLETFQGPLAPYGEWVHSPRYGQVWRPNVAAGWRPYYYGRWEWTNEGWLWVSDEPWGWAAYHYGRWTWDSYFGWIWVPGYQWAPAWVSWRYSGDVIGWAPLGPGFSLYVSTYPFVDFWWTFVPTVRFVATPVYSVAYAPTYTRQWYYRTAPAPARPAPRPGVRPAPAAAPAWGGPAPRFVSERIGRPIAPARIVSAPAPGARAALGAARPGEIPVFRPQGRGAPRGPAAYPAPARGTGAWAPPSVGHGRGPGPAPAQGRGGDRGWA